MPCASLLRLALSGAICAAAEATMKGVSYGVSPTEHRQTRNDDWFGDDSAAQWSRAGRGDLELIQALGANSVRLYGNDGSLDHTNFLDEAHELGLAVIPGNSDWPFMQAPENCKNRADYDCSDEVRQSYAMNLERGFLLPNSSSYHPAISHVIVMNEPDLKLPDVSSPRTFSRALISAMDGMLEAERDAGVDPADGLPNFTVTFSFSLCSGCDRFADKPALGQMWHLRDAMLNPSAYGYEPQNDLAELYRSRFVFSFNTANPSFHIRPLFLDAYAPEFPQTPVFIGEYHWTNPQGDQAQDVTNALRIAEAEPLLLGISFFEFQLRTDVGGHLGYGLLQFGPQTLMTMEYFEESYDIRCLAPVLNRRGRSLPAEVAQAYGGDVARFDTDECIQ